MTVSVQIPRPELVSGELLSSFLVRLAARLGVTPYRLQRQFDPPLEIWTRDVDRTASDALLIAVARRCGLDREAIEAMTLRGYERLFRQTDAVSRQPGVATWINALGIFHRQRTLHGLQYCPACVQEAPVFRQVWRLAFFTVCDKHVVMLRDCCPYCGAAIVPHRSRQAGLRCCRCDRLLGASSLVDLPATHESSAIQRRFLDAALVGKALLGKLDVPASDFFIGAAQLLQVCKSKVAKRSNDDEMLGPQFELLRVAERARCLSLLFMLLEDWPDCFVQFAAKHSVSQNNFAQYKLTPSWVREAVSQLPKRIRAYKRRLSWPQHECRNRVASTGNWRTKHARDVLRAAGVRK